MRRQPIGTPVATRTVPRGVRLVAAATLLLVGFLVVTQLARAAGSISLTTLGAAYTEDFNTLATTGTSSTVPNGWDFAESGTNANTTYTAGTGSSNTGDSYSFGATASTERALGGLQSGSLNPTIGASFTNNTGSPITTLAISYTGEQWRLGTLARPDRIDFQFSTDATSLTTGTWTDHDSLDFSAPVTGPTVGALDGNSSANRTAVSSTITGLNIANGAAFWIRWADFNAVGADDGLAVDDFSLTPSTGPTNPSGVGSASPSSVAPGGASLLAVAVTPGSNPTSTGLAVTANLSAVGGSSSQSFFDDGTNGDVTAGDNIFSFQATVATGTFDGAKSLSVTITDAEARSGSASIALTVASTCADPYTSIHSIQGSGPITPIPGNVTTEGLVVGDFEGPTSAGLQGFYMQEQDSAVDADPATSEGIFVYTGNSLLVNAGDLVRVTGYARERFNQTTLNGANSDSAAVPAANIVLCSSGNTPPAATDVTMPFASADYPERYEGMYVHFPQSLVISEYFNYDRFGEIVLALPLNGETRPFTGTAIDEPGAPANARTLANSLRRITLDDGLGAQNPATLRHPDGNAFSLSNRFRGGDTVQYTIGVLGFDFGLYRIQPTGSADYTATNPRPASLAAIGGDIRVASMNTLNFFLTLDTTASDAGPGPCGANQNLDCRGADSDQPDEFTRQRTKLLAAIGGLNGDVTGLNEIENTPGVDPLGDATNGIVPGLNAAMGAGTYAYINTGVIGTDAIRVGLIYKPAKVTPVGSFQILDSTDDPRFIDTKSRPALAQTFEENATGARFTVVVNHLKSKGSACDDIGDPDTGDGQGNCNQTRKAAAQALVDWLATDPTGSGDADFLIMGDLNSYAQEDPIDAIKLGADDTAGTTDDFTNLVAKYGGAYAYSYVFDGQAGYLDHALASPTLTAQVTGATEWHINADEPDVLDYDTSFKPAAQDALVEPNAFRSSDHDAVVVGLDLRSWSFTGFFQPVDNPPVFNIVKAGQGVPVKFSLGGNQGLGIFASGFPVSRSVACDGGAATDDIEATTSGKSGLSYDRDTDTYTYAWKTDKAWANTCRQLVLILKDGTNRVAYFQFK
jgi:uncharacterized protein